MAASFASASRSAPTNPWAALAVRARSTPPASGMPAVWMASIRSRPSLSGTPISISRSRRPGLRSAGSIESGRLVAAMTTTLPLPLIPSMSVSSCETMRFSTSPETSSRFGAIESISSMNTMLGARSSACLNISRSRSSLSP